MIDDGPRRSDPGLQQTGVGEGVESLPHECIVGRAVGLARSIDQRGNRRLTVGGIPDRRQDRTEPDIASRPGNHESVGQALPDITFLFRLHFLSPC